MTAEWIPAASPNFMVGRAGNQVGLIVLHTTVGTMDATIATFQNPGRIASAHYVVGLDGRLVNMVHESDTAYHAGDWNVNLTSIGIEHVDDGDYNGPRTPELYAASIALVGDLCARYGIPRDRAHIRKHSEVSDAPTGCPDALDVDHIVSGAALFSGGSGSLEDDMPLDPADPIVIEIRKALAGLEGVILTPPANQSWPAIQAKLDLIRADIAAIQTGGSDAAALAALNTKLDRILAELHTP